MQNYMTGYEEQATIIEDLALLFKICRQNAHAILLRRQNRNGQGPLLGRLWSVDAMDRSSLERSLDC